MGWGEGWGGVGWDGVKGGVGWGEGWGGVGWWDGDPAGLGGFNPPQSLFACQFENSYTDLPFGGSRPPPPPPPLLQEFLDPPVT